MIFPSRMPLYTSSGEAVQPETWIGMQVQQISGWTDISEWDGEIHKEEVAGLWTKVMAESARKICNSGIPVDLFDEKFTEFKNERLTPHIQKAKWFTHELQPESGLSVVKELLRTKLTIDSFGYDVRARLDFIFLPVDGTSPQHVETFEITHQQAPDYQI